MRLNRYKLYLLAAILILFNACAKHSEIWLNAALQLNPTPALPLACDSTITAAYGGGTGISTDPYTICNVSQWLYLGTDSNSWNKYFKLYSDIDFTSVTIATFKSIGTAGTPFTGQVDGNNFKLMNLNIIGTNTGLAFFTQTNGNATFKNLTLKNITLTATARLAGLVLDHGNGGTITLTNVGLDTVNLKANVASHKNGGLVANSLGPVIINTANLHSMIFTSASGTCRFNGALLGYSTGAVAISNVTGDTVGIVGGTNMQQSGGIVGYIAASATFSDINVTGITLPGSLMGGLASQVWYPTLISKVHLSGSIDGAVLGAGLIGEIVGNGTPLVVTESSFSGTLISTNGGGLFDTIYGGDVSISKSYFKGTMTSIWNGTGAGLVKNIQGTTNTLTITDSYVIADMTGIAGASDTLGGLVGRSSPNVSISRSYFSGTLNGAGVNKACIGRTSGTTSFSTADVYYDSTLCTSTADTGGGTIVGSTGIATATLQTATPFTNWLASAWTFTASQNPKLIWEP